MSISADEGIKLLQMIERFICPNSVEIDEEVAKIYQAWIQVIPGNITPLKNFIQFVQSADVCKLLRTSLEV